FLETTYIEEFNRRFNVPPAQTGTAFAPLQRQDLERVFSIQHDRTVNDDNTVQIAKKVLQIEPTSIRSTLAGCRIIVYEHLDDTISIGFGPHTVGRYDAHGALLPTLSAAKSARKRKPNTKSGVAAHRPAPRKRPINDPGAKVFTAGKPQSKATVRSSLKA